jgi:predicted porin
MVRIGRGRPAYQESVASFDPWHGLPSPAGFYTDLTVAGYNSDPLGAPVGSNNRWSNAVWYNSNPFSGFQFNATFGTKEANGGPAVVGTGTAAAPQYPANSEASAHPFSVSGTYNNGPIGAILGYERNAIETKVWTAGGSFAPVPDLRLMATYSKQDQGHTRVFNPKTKAWVLGATYAMGPGKVLAGYGQKHPDGAVKTKQMSLGYEYSLSKRTYVYLDASRKKDITTATGALAIPDTVNHYDIGLNHSF